MSQSQNPNPNSSPATAIEPELLIPLLDNPDFPVDARNLHRELGVRAQFTDWMYRRIEEYKFEENQDFILLHNFMKQKNGADSGPDSAPDSSLGVMAELFGDIFPEYRKSKEGSGGHNRKDYHITFDMAKELAMVEKTDKGRYYRRYFIKCQNTLHELAAKNALPIPETPPAIDFSKLIKTLDYLDMLAPRFAQYLTLRQAGISLEMSARALGRGDDGCRPLDKALRQAGLVKSGTRIKRGELSTRLGSPTLADVISEEVN